MLSQKNNNINIVPQQVFSRPDVRTSVTSTRFKVKVKVTELLKLRKLHCSTSISSGVLAWNSKLTVDWLQYSIMEPSLQLFGARFLNFSPSWRSRDFEVREMLISPESTAFYLRAGRRYRSLWLWLQVGRNKPCTLAAMTFSPFRGYFLWICSKIPLDVLKCPTDAPFTRYNRLSNRLYNRFDNRMYRVNKHPTGCQSGCQSVLTTGWTTVLSNRVVQPVWQPAYTRYSRLSNRLSSWMFVYTIQPVIKLVWQPVWQQVVSCKRGLRIRKVLTVVPVRVSRYPGPQSTTSIIGVYPGVHFRGINLTKF